MSPDARRRFLEIQEIAESLSGGIVPRSNAAI
jgi:hypothetical protein